MFSYSTIILIFLKLKKGMLVSERSDKKKKCFRFGNLIRDNLFLNNLSFGAILLKNKIVVTVPFAILSPVYRHHYPNDGETKDPQATRL